MKEAQTLAIIGDCITHAVDAKDLARRLAAVLEIKTEPTRMIDAFADLVHSYTDAMLVREGTYRVDRINGDDGAVILVAEFIPHGADNEAPDTGPSLNYVPKQAFSATISGDGKSLPEMFGRKGDDPMIQQDETKTIDASRDLAQQADGDLVKSVPADGPLPHATPASELPAKPVSDTATRVLDAQAVLRAAQEDPEPLPEHDEPPGIAQVMEEHEARKAV